MAYLMQTNLKFDLKNKDLSEEEKWNLCCLTYTI